MLLIAPQEKKKKKEEEEEGKEESSPPRYTVRQAHHTKDFICFPFLLLSPPLSRGRCRERKEEVANFLSLILRRDLGNGK